jgi:hypothetical protein
MTERSKLLRNSPPHLYRFDAERLKKTKKREAQKTEGVSG